VRKQPLNLNARLYKTINQEIYTPKNHNMIADCLSNQIKSILQNVMHQTI